jgi:inner membrane protein
MDMSAASTWVVLGVILLIIEIISVSFYSVFFGIAAIIVGLLTYMGVFDDLPTQVGVFGLVSLLSLYLFREKFMDAFLKKGQTFTEFVDEHAKVSVEIGADSEGKVFYRGTDWIALEKNGKAIAANAKVVIRKIDGIKLIVEEI